MNTNKNWRYKLVPIAFLGLLAPFTGCEDDLGPVGDIAKQCGLVCAEKGVLEGNASISGNASVDAFFGAVVDFKGAVDGVSAGIQGEIDAIGASLGVEAGGDVAAALKAKIAANVDGGLQIKAAPPKCSASLEVTANAAASCDAKVDPGSVEVKCEGSCTVDASVQADCSAKGKLTCKGTAPSLKCEGSCTGSCNLEVGAKCEGKCNGECSGSTDSGGKCNGDCKGSCELEAGGKCEGKCEGSCEFTPPSGSCDASMEAKCEASADANIKCKGGCDGKVSPPSVSAECKATVEAKANASAECTPPSLDVAFKLKGSLDANAQAEFKAWLVGFKGHFAALLAASAKADILAEAGANLAGAGSAAVEGFVGSLKGSADLKASVGAACALAQLPKAGEALQASGAKITASVSAVADITSVVK